MPLPKWSRLETEATKDQRAGHHVGHHERSSVSDAEVPHMNSPLTEIRIRVVELTAVNSLPPELEPSVDLFIYGEIHYKLFPQVNFF